MKIKRVILAGTLAVAITVGGSLWSGADKRPSSSQQMHSSAETTVLPEDQFHEALGASSDEKIYDALYNGKSLAQIAVENQGNVEKLIDLQVGQMTEQLDARLAQGTISAQQYQLQKDELRSIITKSVYGA